MTETKPNTPQEIDLIELFTNIGNWIKRIFFNVLYFFLRNALYFILLVIFGILAGIISYFASKPYYKSELIAYSHTINNIEVLQYVNNWNYKAAFTEDQLEKIKDVSALYLLDRNKDGIWDMIEEKPDKPVVDTAILNKRVYGNFCIRIEVYDTTMIPLVKEKVLAYLESNPRSKEINIIRLQQAKELIPKIQKEIDDLDSLKRMQYFDKDKLNQDKKGDLLILNEKETKLFYGDILGLIQRQQSIQRDLFLNPDPYEIVQDFSVPFRSENSIVKNVEIFTLISLVLGFFLILYYDQRYRVLKLIKESKERKMSEDN